MTATVRPRFWVETALAGSAGVLAAVTLVWRDWIEALTGFDPDRHDGSLEWAIVAGLALLSALLTVVARAEWRRPRAAGATQT